jgi:hypothetical protein
MSTLAKRESLPAVTAAAVVAIVFSLFGALGSLLAAFSLLVMPEMPTAGGAPPVPPGVRTMSAAVMFFMLALAVFGIFVGLGIFRRRNWARIAILIWGGFMTFVCVGALAFSFVIFSALPMQLSNVNAADPGSFMVFMKIFFFVFYGIPACVGIWWLVLFTRTRVADAFTNPAHYAPAMDASGFPQLEVAAASQQQKRPTCPLPLAILAGLFIFGAVSLALFAFVPLPSDVPFFFFGHAFAGVAGRSILILFGLVSGIAGVGIFKLRPWALYTEIVFQCVGLLNCIVTFLSPSYVPAMRVAMEKMYSQNPAFARGSLFLSDTYFRSSMIFATVFVGAALLVLLWQRSRFLEQAAAAAKA